MNDAGGAFVVAIFVSAVVGAIIGSEKGNAGKGALLGFFLGPVGWIMAMCDIGIIWLAVLIGAVVAIGLIAIR